MGSNLMDVCDDLISVAEELGAHFEMTDGPCASEALCGAWICENTGCIKDKADRARKVLAGLGASQ